jgi:hypothetical protein
MTAPTTAAPLNGYGRYFATLNPFVRDLVRAAVLDGIDAYEAERTRHLEQFRAQGPDEQQGGTEAVEGAARDLARGAAVLAVLAAHDEEVATGDTERTAVSVNAWANAGPHVDVTLGAAQMLADQIARVLPEGSDVWAVTESLEALLYYELRLSFGASDDDAAARAQQDQFAVLADILGERARQDKQWGGAGHDDQHEMGDWLRFIKKQFDAADTTLEHSEYRSRLVKIAATAVAAIESHDRFQTQPESEAPHA